MESSSRQHASVARWAVLTSNWQPEKAEFAALLELLPQHEKDACLRFFREEDRKRALVSRLLQRKCVSEHTRQPYSEIVIRRTERGKPFPILAKRQHAAPNFNFNVSHEGDYVVLASEYNCICGVDVAAPQQLRRTDKEPFTKLVELFKPQFSNNEYALLNSFGHDERLMESQFQRFWSLKEAFIKARGDGLALEPLSRVEFRFPGADPWALTASVALDGQLQHRWRFYLQELGSGHWVTVARGPPDAVEDPQGEFKATLQRPHMEDDELRGHLDAPNPPFEVLTIGDLIPSEHIRQLDAWL